MTAPSSSPDASLQANQAMAKSLELLIRKEDLDPAKWIDYPEYGFRQYFLWKNPATSASIALLEYQKGGRIPVKHSHASNQFMYCLEGGMRTGASIFFSHRWPCPYTG